MRKIYLSYFLLFFISICFGQNDHGILIKTNVFSNFTGGSPSPLISSYVNVKIGAVDYTFGTQGIGVFDVYRFFYINDNPNSIIYKGYWMGYMGVCNQPPSSIPYNKYTFRDELVYACTAKTEFMGIHILPATTTTTPCIEDTIELKNGYNWQYSYNLANPD